MGPSLDRVVLEWERTPPATRRQARFRLADVLLEVDSDDPALIDELSSVLGRPRRDAADGPVHARFEARARAQVEIVVEHGGARRCDSRRRQQQESPNPEFARQRHFRPHARRRPAIGG